MIWYTRILWKLYSIVFTHNINKKLAEALLPQNSTKFHKIIKFNFLFYLKFKTIKIWEEGIVRKCEESNE